MLQVAQTEFGGDDRIRLVHFVGHAAHGLVQAQAGFHAHDHQVQGVGQSQEDLFFAAFGEPPQNDLGQVEHAAGHEDALQEVLLPEQRRAVQMGHQHHDAAAEKQADDQHGEFQAQEQRRCGFAAKPGLRHLGFQLADIVFVLGLQRFGQCRRGHFPHAGHCLGRDASVAPFRFLPPADVRVFELVESLFGRRGARRQQVHHQPGGRTKQDERQDREQQG